MDGSGTTIKFRLAVGKLPLSKCFEQDGFSPRESEVLLWLTEGKTNAEMALLMRVHVQTIKFHLTSIYNRIGVGNRLAATLHALELLRRSAVSKEKPRIIVKVGE